MGRRISTHFFMMDIIEKVRKIIDNLLREKEIELVDISYRREHGGMVLRLLVDKEGSITLDDCSYLNEELGKILDREDVIPERYLLEVSSPGLDRPLKTKRDFERAMGKMVQVHTYEPVNDKRDIEGTISYVDDEKVKVGEFEIKLNKIAKAKLKIEI